MITTRIGLGQMLRYQPGVFKASRPRISVRGVKTPTIDWKPIKTATTNVTEAASHAKTPILRRVFLGLMIAMPVVSFVLGCWQVKRLQWKVYLISKCEKLLAREPLPSLPPDLDPEMISEFEFRRFRLKGSFDYSQEMFLGPRMRNGTTGYLVVTPFHRSDGGEPILVERGWISKEKVIPETRAKGYLSHLALPQGEVEIEALFRNMPKKSSLQFDHEESTRLFYVPDVDSMAKQAHTLPVYCQMIYDMKDHPDYISPSAKPKSWSLGNIFSKKNTGKELFKNDDFELEFQEFEFIKNGVPVGTVPKVNFTNNHLQYLVTWFGLCIASSALLVYNMYKTKKFGSAEKIINAKRKDMKKW